AQINTQTGSPCHLAPAHVITDAMRRRTGSTANLIEAYEPHGGHMRYLHTMVRISDIDASLDFYCNVLGMREVKRMESEAGRFTLIYLAAPHDHEHATAESAPLLELTYNWDPEKYGEGRNFGHLAFEVDDIYATCQRVSDAGITINRPPRDGH